MTCLSESPPRKDTHKLQLSQSWADPSCVSYLSVLCFSLCQSSVSVEAICGHTRPLQVPFSGTHQHQGTHPHPPCHVRQSTVAPLLALTHWCLPSARHPSHLRCCLLPANAITTLYPSLSFLLTLLRVHPRSSRLSCFLLSLLSFPHTHISAHFERCFGQKARIDS